MNPDKSERGAAELLGHWGRHLPDGAVRRGDRPYGGRGGDAACVPGAACVAFAPRAAWHGADAGERRRLADAVRADAMAAAAPDSQAARERLLPATLHPRCSRCGDCPGRPKYPISHHLNAVDAPGLPHSSRYSRSPGIVELLPECLTRRLGFNKDLQCVMRLTFWMQWKGSDYRSIRCCVPIAQACTPGGAPSPYGNATARSDGTTLRNVAMRSGNTHA